MKALTVTAHSLGAKPRPESVSWRNTWEDECRFYMNLIAKDKDHHLPIIAVIHSSVSYLSILKFGGFRRDLCAAKV